MSDESVYWDEGKTEGEREHSTRRMPSTKSSFQPAVSQTDRQSVSQTDR